VLRTVIKKLPPHLYCVTTLLCEICSCTFRWHSSPYMAGFAHLYV